MWLRCEVGRGLIIASTRKAAAGLREWLVFMGVGLAMASAGKAGELVCVLVVLMVNRSIQNVARAPRMELICQSFVLICQGLAFMVQVQGARRAVRGGIFADGGEHGCPEGVRCRARRERTRSGLAGGRAIDLLGSLCMDKDGRSNFFRVRWRRVIGG